ncbi:MAG: GNAT family N-acetyltransferase [Deltaproteobacteria bacterium]|nr:GNAT family N-acetyltransferase [Deltaproteobacteria bacterium]
MAAQSTYRRCVTGPGPILRTPRLILRPWRDEDAAPFAAMGADPEVMQHFPNTLTREQSDATMDRIRAHFEREGFGFWAVEIPGVAPFAGFTGIGRPAFMPVVEIGWRYARAHWGHGYATEAAIAARDWGFANLGIDEIVAFVVPGNARSQRVMDRLGMRRDPAADFEHPLIAPGHRLRPHWLYRLRKPAAAGAAPAT